MAGLVIACYFCRPTVGGMGTKRRRLSASPSRASAGLALFLAASVFFVFVPWISVFFVSSGEL